MTLTGQSQAVSGTAKAGGTANVAVKVTPADDRRCRARTRSPSSRRSAGTAVPDRARASRSPAATRSSLSTPTPGPVRHGPCRQRHRAGVHASRTPAPRRSRTSRCRDSLPTNWKVDVRPGDDRLDRSRPVRDRHGQDHAVGRRDRGRLLADVHRRAARRPTTPPEIRFTVEASIVGAIIGGALIVAFVVGLLWVFRRYGRR